jgi:polar amino acid transport system substrate-binding protein
MLIVRANDGTFDECRTKEDVEAILQGFDSTVTIGYQEETTSGLYLSGTQTNRRTAFNVTAKGYDTTAHAVQALINGEINYVIADGGPAKIIVSDVNK